jgi:hypothetical protein
MVALEIRSGNEPSQATQGDGNELIRNNSRDRPYGSGSLGLHVTIGGLFHVSPHRNWGITRGSAVDLWGLG